MAQTITFQYPVVGTVAPTQLQALGVNMVTATLNWSDSETSAAIVHNFKLSTTQLANLWPVVIVDVRSDSTSTVVPLIAVALTDSSTVTISKPTTVGTQGTLIVVIMRPFSEIT